MKRIDVAGGPPQTICDATLIIGGSMEPKRDYHLWRRNWDRRSRDPSSSGKWRYSQTSHRSEYQERGKPASFPVFLPDGQHFLYTIQSARTGDGGVYLGRFASRKSAIVF